MSQLKTKAFQDSSITSVKIGANEVATADIAANAVTDVEIRLTNNGQFKSRNVANSADVSIVRVNGSDKIEFADGFVFQNGGNVLIENEGGIGDLTLRTNDQTGASTNSGAMVIESGDVAGATSNSGNVSLITGTATGVRGNVILDGLDVNAVAAGDINLTATDDIVALGDVLDVGGMNAIELPQQAADPTAVTARFYYNTGANTVKYYNGSAWVTLSTGSSVTGNKETFTLIAGDITNQYIDLANVALTGTIHFIVKGLGPLLEGASHDYSVSYTGGAGGNTRINFLNDIATGGGSALIATDVVQVVYSY